jgi:hypothetical protein
LAAKTKELEAARAKTAELRALATKRWEENKAANLKAKEIAAKMKEARALAKELHEAARDSIKARTEEVQRLLGEAREEAWKQAGASTNIAGLASELVQ